MRITEHIDAVAMHNGHTCQLNDGLISNWPSFDGFEGRPDRSEQWKYFIDSRQTGLTIGEAASLKVAKRLALELGGVVRPFLVTDDVIREYNSSQRSLRRAGVI